MPINQEDLGGTLMTFSLVVLDALRRLGVSISAQEHRAYVHAWNCAGDVMGIDARLLTRDVGAAEAFWERVKARRWAPSPEGQAMTKALVDAMAHATPARSPTASRATSCATWAVTSSATSSASSARTGRGCWAGRCASSRDFHAAVDCDPGLAQVAAHFSRQLLEGFSWVVRGGQRAPFDIPQALADRWDVRTAASVVG